MSKVNQDDAHLPPIADPAALNARAAAHDLGTAWDAPPGNALEHSTAGFAKILASNVFLTGLDPDFAARHVGFFTSPLEDRHHVVETKVDYDNRSVQLTLDNGTVRTARQFGDQGCITIPLGADDVFFEPSAIESTLPPADTTLWPMGDVLPDAWPNGIDRNAIAAAVDAAFEPDETMTAAYVVTYKGQIIGERYRDGISIRTPLESWSMGKSLSATLLGILVGQGVYEIDQPAPIPEWQETADPRAAIRIVDILQMSSGLKFRARQDPDWSDTDGYPDHLYVYTGGIDAFHWAATRAQQWPPGTIGRYRNCDPVLTNYLTRLAVEGRGENYHAHPTRALFDRIGIRSMILETDPFGNFLTQGYEFGAARDWARLAMLYLDDGLWLGERILPEGWARFVSTLAPAWKADGRPIYGGLFWLNGAGTYPIPLESYYMAGAGNQKTIIIPSHDLAVVRIGHYSGAEIGDVALKRSLAMLMDAIPSSA